MNQHSIRWVGFFLSLLAMAVSACAGWTNPEGTIPFSPTSTPAGLQQTYNDPFAYCAAVGTIDSPDARYTGPQISEAIINGYKTAAGLEASTEPMEVFKTTTIWRCMDSQVYTCNFGANLPCSLKANQSKTPTPEMEEYCKANPDSDFVPMSVTGHDTIYSWECVKDIPTVLEQIEKVDAAGYQAGIWYAILPGTNPYPSNAATPIVAPSITPAFLPSLTPTPLGGSSQILFSSNRGGAYGDLYLLDLTSVQVTRLTQGDSNFFPGPFSPDGSQFLFTGFGLTTSYVGVMSADGSSPKDLTQAEIDEGFPAWSPNGTTIAFTSRRDGNNEIYLMNADGSQPRRLTNNPTDDFAPAWSPDGSQIAFVSDRKRVAGMYSIYLMNADGSRVTRLTKNKGIDYTPVWSPDGKQIAFRSSLDGSSDIYVINVDGSSLKNLTQQKGENWSPAWSPDGRLIAFQTNRDGNWEIYIMNTDGSNPLNLTNNPAVDQMPYWR